MGSYGSSNGYGPAEKVQRCLFGNARKEGKESGGCRAWDGTKVLFFSSSPPGRVPDQLHAVAEAQGGDKQGPLCLPTTPSGPRSQGKPTAAAPRPYLSPFQVAPSMAKGKGYMHLAGQRGKGATYQIQQPDTFGRPLCRLSPLPRAVSAASTHTHCSGGRGEGGALCPQSHAPSVLRPLHCRLVCNCGEPPDRDPAWATTVPSPQAG